MMRSGRIGAAAVSVAMQLAFLTAAAAWIAVLSPAAHAQPLPALACPLEQLARKSPKVPKLLTAYLSLGAKIAGPPAIDREFKTIDFLTFLDLDALPEDTVRRYLT